MPKRYVSKIFLKQLYITNANFSLKIFFPKFINQQISNRTKMQPTFKSTLKFLNKKKKRERAREKRKERGNRNQGFPFTHLSLGLILDNHALTLWYVYTTYNLCLV